METARQSPKTEAAITIDVVFDAVCPWCFIGKRRLEHALAQRPALRPVHIHWRPFLLNPQMPPEGIDRGVYLARKFGGEARIRRVLDAIAEAGRTVGIDFAFQRIRRTPNTLDAHRLVRLAAAHEAAGAAVEALFQAYFIDGRDTGRAEELIAIYESLGLDGTELAHHLSSQTDVTTVYEENARAHRMGINGVPSFLFNGQLAISGAQEPQVLARVLDVAGLPGLEAAPLPEDDGSMSRP